jgi:hypothetical protein
MMVDTGEKVTSLDICNVGQASAGCTIACSNRIGGKTGR